MSRLRQLSEILGQRLSLDAGRSLGQTDQLDRPLQELNANSRAGLSAAVPIDQQLAAINKFRKSQELVTLREARLVAYGLCLRVSPEEEAIIDNASFLTAALSSHSGVGQWAGNPLSFRRCYQGLVSSYFAYDKHAKERSNVALSNWQRLGEYLYRENNRIVDVKANPDWVKTASDHRDLFGPDPCAPYASDALDGDPTVLPYLEQQLGIGAGSWFRQELVLSVIREATLRPDEQFKRYIPRLLRLLEDHEAQEHEGLALILDKYAASIGGEANVELRDFSVNLWGSPWLPSKDQNWRRVTKPARDLVSYWLRRDFVQAFFTKLAEDRIGDRRRLSFWSRYVRSMQSIHFGLGATARNDTSEDFLKLLDRMKGIYTDLEGSVRDNNAFIMRFPRLVAVAFGEKGNALYIYDADKQLPFDLAQPLSVRRDVSNSLKHTEMSRHLPRGQVPKRLRYVDRGIEPWEALFERELAAFGVYPDHRSVGTARAAERSNQSTNSAGREGKGQSQQSIGARAGSLREGAGKYQPPVSFSMPALRRFADQQALKIEDKRPQGGNLWVLTKEDDAEVRLQLEQWGFRHKPERGWWKK